MCVDEAQQIECHTARATEMLLKLHAVNRWCVTGTPIRRNIEGKLARFLLLIVAMDRCPFQPALNRP